MPVLNLQVAASGDDGVLDHSGSSIDASATWLIVGDDFGTSKGNWYRFASVSGIGGATINDANLRLTNRTAIGSQTSQISAENAVAPAAPTNYANYVAKTKTTLVAFDNANGGGDETHHDCTATVQSLADSHDPSAVQIFHTDNGSGFGAYGEYYSYDASTSLAPKLDIDYTAADPGDLNVLEGAESIPDGTTTPRDFGSVLVGDAAPQKTFTVENLGDDTISITSITVPAGYEIDAGSELDGGADTIGGGLSKTLVVNLLTDTAGTFAGDIEIDSDDADEATYNFAIIGQVREPSFSRVAIARGLARPLASNIARPLT